jgi:hypothetical protein
VIRVSVEIGGGAARFRASVRAESIERAVGIASTRYPGSEVRLLFPIDPEAFFSEDPVLAERLIRLEMPEEEAG